MCGAHYLTINIEKVLAALLYAHDCGLFSSAEIAELRAIALAGHIVPRSILDTFKQNR
jgi:hypothetical protein